MDHISSWVEAHPGELSSSYFQYNVNQVSYNYGQEVSYNPVKFDGQRHFAGGDMFLVHTVLKEHLIKES